MIITRSRFCLYFIFNSFNFNDFWCYMFENVHCTLEAEGTQLKFILRLQISYRTISQNALKLILNEFYFAGARTFPFSVACSIHSNTCFQLKLCMHAVTVIAHRFYCLLKNFCRCAVYYQKSFWICGLHIFLIYLYCFNIFLMHNDILILMSRFLMISIAWSLRQQQCAEAAGPYNNTDGTDMLTLSYCD